MKKLIIAAMMLTLSIGATAQNVVKQGNVFTSVSNKKTAAKDSATAYQYADSKGVVYKVMLSSTGKAFIWKTSKKTGKTYKEYLPEIGKQINPKAYIKKKGQ
jgi:hypothetical protein